MDKAGALQYPNNAVTCLSIIGGELAAAPLTEGASLAAVPVTQLWCRRVLNATGFLSCITAATACTSLPNATSPPTGDPAHGPNNPERFLSAVGDSTPSADPVKKVCSGTNHVKSMKIESYDGGRPTKITMTCTDDEVLVLGASNGIPFNYNLSCGKGMLFSGVKFRYNSNLITSFGGHCRKVGSETGELPIDAFPNDPNNHGLYGEISSSSATSLCPDHTFLTGAVARYSSTKGGFETIAGRCR